MRTHVESERDKVFIAERYCQGATLAKIALELRDKYYPGSEPLSIVQISRDMKVVVERWRKAASFSLDQYKAIEIQKINALEQEYYDAWMKSKESKERTLTERLEQNERNRTRARVATEGRDGNPAFLLGVQWCIDRRCKILGLDTPAKVEASGDVNLHVIYENRRPSGVNVKVE